jgi:hypothetical protein
MPAPLDPRSAAERPIGLTVPPPPDEPPGKLSADEARAVLQLAILAQEPVRITLRGPVRAEGPRVIDGMPVGFRASGDGRERVVLRYSDEREQLVLLGRISDVAPLR